MDTANGTRIRTSVLFLLPFTLVVSPAVVFGQSGTRSLSGPAVPASTFLVSIVIDMPPQVSTLGLEDSPPVGWTVVSGSISGGGAFDGVNNKVKWGPFFSGTFPPEVHYDVAFPVTMTGPQCFVGAVSADGPRYPIVGDDCVDPCASGRECDDSDICSLDECSNGFCSFDQPNFQYGDVDHNGAINLFDITCVLNSFSGDFDQCPFKDVDIEPCSGNDTLNILDVFAILDAFTGVDPCCNGLP